MIACDNKKQEIGGAFIMHKFKVVLLVKRIAQNTCTTNALYKYVGMNNHKYFFSKALRNVHFKKWQYLQSLF